MCSDYEEYLNKLKRTGNRAVLRHALRLYEDRCIPWRSLILLLQPPLSHIACGLAGGSSVRVFINELARRVMFDSIGQEFGHGFVFVF